MYSLLISYPLLSALVALGSLSVLFGGVLGFAAVRLRVEGNPIVAEVSDLLPQSQCGQCGYPGCVNYAEAIVSNGEALNKCPPGGQATINAIANLLGVEAPKVDEENVISGPMIAYIDETDCYGCTKCLRDCPVDAIIGATKMMHTVIDTDCTGCGLCIDTCSKNCIAMYPVPVTTQNWCWELPEYPVVTSRAGTAPC